MSGRSRKFAQYFYSHIEFPPLERETTMKTSCELDGFFHFYCSILNGRSQQLHGTIARIQSMSINGERRSFSTIDDEFFSLPNEALFEVKKSRFSTEHS